MNLIGNFFKSIGRPITKATGLSDGQVLGLGALAAAPFALPALVGAGATAPAAVGAAGAGAGIGAGAAAPVAAGAAKGGLLSQASSVMLPISQGLQISNQVAAMNQQQPIQPAPMQQRPGPDLSQFIAMEGQRNQMMDAERQKRLQQQQMALGGLLGGANGRIA